MPHVERMKARCEAAGARLVVLVLSTAPGHALIDELLDSPRHALHFSNVWRALLIPEVAASPEARIFQPGFEAWLKLKLRANVPFDQLVNELLTTQIAVEQQTPESVLKHPEKPNPLAYFPFRYRHQDDGSVKLFTWGDAETISQSVKSGRISGATMGSPVSSRRTRSTFGRSVRPTGRRTKT
jgi:hypothetical protein